MVEDVHGPRFENAVDEFGDDLILQKLNILEDFIEGVHVIALCLGMAIVALFKVLNTPFQLSCLPLVVLNLLSVLGCILHVVSSVPLCCEHSEKCLLKNVGDINLLNELDQEGPHDLLHALILDDLHGIPILCALFVPERHVILFS